MHSILQQPYDGITTVRGECNYIRLLLPNQTKIIKQQQQKQHCSRRTSRREYACVLNSNNKHVMSSQQHNERVYIDQNQTDISMTTTTS
jgi:hypothetical protein